MQISLDYWFETSLYRYPPQKKIKFGNCKKIYKIYIYVNCYAQNSVRNDIRCMMGYGFDSWFL